MNEKGYMKKLFDFKRIYERVFETNQLFLSVYYLALIFHSLIKLLRMTHSYRASVSTLDGINTDTADGQKKKTIETGCMQLDSNNNRNWHQRTISLW